MRRWWTFGAAFAAVAVGAALVVVQLPAGAIDVSDTPTPVTGNATWFSGLGSPYGGCGLPQSALDSQNFLALNVQNSPGNYTNLPRPIPESDASEIGMFDNGRNCGRWVRVNIGNYCTGTNDGAPNEPFCRNGSLVSDAYNGATLDFVVADSCDDGNAWCKDDPYHVDLAQASLNQFMLNGAPVGDMYPDHWNNRQVSWQFVSAPNYAGDIKTGAIQGSQPYWSAIAVSHLPNGIHGVQYFANGAWTDATMDADQGDDYIIAPTTGAGTGGSQYQIRVIDASDSLVNNGEVYNFTLPASCVPSGCSAAYTPISYTTQGGTTGDTTPPSAPTAVTVGATTPSSVALSWTASTDNLAVAGYQVFRDGALVGSPSTRSFTDTGLTPNTSYSYTVKAEDAAGNVSAASAAVSATTQNVQQTGGCSATYHIDSDWGSGFVVTVTVINTGTTATKTWSAAWTFGGNQQVTSMWNATPSGSGHVTATNDV